jgi:hypothetical protein
MPVTPAAPHQPGQLLMNLPPSAASTTSDGDLAAQYPAGVRRARRRAGPRPVRQPPRTSTRSSPRPSPPARRPSRDLSGQVETMRESYQRPVHRHRAGGRAGLSVPGHQLPELDRSADRADGGAVRAGRRHVDAVPDPDALSVPALMGTLMCIGLTTANSILVVSFANQRMDAGDEPADRGGDRRLHPSAPGADDRRRHDSRHDPDGAGRRRGRRAERAAGPRGHRRLLFATFATLVFVPTSVNGLSTSAITSTAAR